MSTPTGAATMSEAPQHARVYYKAVAIVEDRFVSIYDGTTEYPLDRVRHLRTGIWVSPSLVEVVRHTRTRLPSGSMLLEQPRAILRIFGWCADGRAPLNKGQHNGIELD